MARIRSIHPGFFTDESFVQVSAFARLLLIGLGVESDEQGTCPWKPITLKMRLFPVDPIDIQELLRELEEADAIRRYRDPEGREYGAIRNFRVHQRPKSPNSINFIPDDFRNYVGLTPPDFGNDETLTPSVSPKGRNVSADGEEDVRKGRVVTSSNEEGVKPISIEELISEWNIIAKRYGLATVVKMSQTREKKAKLQIRRFPLHDWQAIFRKIAMSAFLKGSNDRQWKIDFDFILSEGNFIKILEGKYDGK